MTGQQSIRVEIARLRIPAAVLRTADRHEVERAVRAAVVDRLGANGDPGAALSGSALRVAFPPPDDPGGGRR